VAIGSQQYEARGWRVYRDSMEVGGLRLVQTKDSRWRWKPRILRYLEFDWPSGAVYVTVEEGRDPTFLSKAPQRGDKRTDDGVRLARWARNDGKPAGSRRRSARAQLYVESSGEVLEVEQARAGWSLRGGRSPVRGSTNSDDRAIDL
jgi:hypothetical protein